MQKKIPYAVALLPLIILISLIAYNLYFYKSESLEGANQYALLFSGFCAIIIALIYKKKWSRIQDSIITNIKESSLILFILLLVGALSGTWLVSGIIPAMMYYGLKILHPDIFLVACCLISAMVALASGSSWSTIATVGIALIGIGQALGFSNGIISGAIISGAYFGDKMSPMSDTTNVAEAVTKSDLFLHIRYMMYTTVPSFLITIIIFSFLGSSTNEINIQNINQILKVLENTFNINFWLFLTPIILIILIIYKTPPLKSLMIASLLGCVFAIIFQTDVLITLSGEESFGFKTICISIIQAITSETYIETENDMINNILSSGGMHGMLNTIWLIISAMFFSGAMQGASLLKRITFPLIKNTKKTIKLISSTAGTCLFFNITTSDQYLSIVVPGRMFSDAYKEQGLASENLSRTLEDTGTVTSVLIPWNTCGATQSAILGVSTLTYMPFCFFNIISPIMTIAFAFFNIKIKKLKI